MLKKQSEFIQGREILHRSGDFWKTQKKKKEKRKGIIFNVRLAKGDAITYRAWIIHMSVGERVVKKRLLSWSFQRLAIDLSNLALAKQPKCCMSSY